MKKSIKKRVLALVLAMMMLIPMLLLTASVMAEEEEENCNHTLSLEVVEYYTGGRCMLVWLWCKHGCVQRFLYNGHEGNPLNGCCGPCSTCGEPWVLPGHHK